MKYFEAGCGYFFVSAILVAGVVGCEKKPDTKGITNLFMQDYKKKKTELPYLPTSAEKKLLEAVQSQRIIDLSELVFSTRGGKNYLGVSASFAIDWNKMENVFHHSYVLGKDINDPSWSTATIYRWNLSRITYVDSFGNTLSVEPTSLNKLFSLPYSNFTNTIYEVKGMDEVVGPRLRLSDEISSEHSTLTTNPPPRGAADFSDSESSTP